LLWFYLSVWHHHVIESVVVLTLQMELMLTVPVEDWIVFQQNYLVTLIYCKSVTTNRLCCICNIYYCACMNNEDTTGVVKPEIKVQTIAKTKETTRHTMNYKTIHIKLVRDSSVVRRLFFLDLLEAPVSRKKSRQTAEEYRTNIKLKIWSESSFCSTSGARHVILVTDPVICYKWGQDRNISSNSSGFTSYLNISFVFTQRLTLRSIQRTSDAYDNPLTSCSIPYTDLRIIIMNYVLKRWNGQLRPEN
jgi:hypothetical protein